jgi:hypothetical protein
MSSCRAPGLSEEQIATDCMGDMMLPCAGCGAEAANGQPTRLTSLHMSVGWIGARPHRHVLPEEMPHSMQRLTRQRLELACVPLHLQRLGGSNSSNGSSGLAAGRNTSLQDLPLECMGQLSDDELAVAASALSDLRRLKVTGHDLAQDKLIGLYDARLAAAQDLHIHPPVH